MKAKLDTALISQMTGGLWQDKSEKTAPIKEKLASISLYRQETNTNASNEILEKDLVQFVVNESNANIERTQQDSLSPVEVKASIDYHREKGESLERYMQRYHVDLFLASIINSGVTEERAIIDQSKRAYLEMAKVGKYYNLPEVKSQRERKLAILDGALLFSD